MCRVEIDEGHRLGTRNQCRTSSTSLTGEPGVATADEILNSVSSAVLWVANGLVETPPGDEEWAAAELLCEGARLADAAR